MHQLVSQDLTTMIVRKAVNMVQKMGKRVVGVVENMRYFAATARRIEVHRGGRQEGGKMAKETVEQEDALKRRMAEEEEIREKVDEDGTRWIKVYFGGGTHFKNWLSQSVELKGEGNVKVEEVDSTAFQCYRESGEKMYRIWVKDTVCPGDVCVPDPGHKESKQQLLEKWHSLHPGETPVFEP